ncbi:MAG TPA: UDP-N-acetylmuramate--L-alanine ligase [Candidatus Limnocylindria bacterium]|nr:UDP-N-acetylmuramate--L-alanine ligase [Candidatus Limnocylindria bacterium]
MIAACGVGMSALASLLREAGHEVTGSDEGAYPPASTLLESLGIRLQKGYDPARLDGADVVICGNAVRSTNPEAVAARERNLRVMSFPQALEELFLESRRPVVVAGTHGKTTSASMLAYVLGRTGRAPGYLIGGAPLDLPTAAALGRGEWFVIEGDEYDSAYFDKEPKFLHYHPALLVLTAVEFDHADIYRDVDHVKAAFRKLLNGLAPAVPVIACTDFPHVRDLVDQRPGALRRFGLDDPAEWRVSDLVDDGTTHFVVRERGRKVVDVRLRVPGAINARNALGVLLAAREIGLEWDEAAGALADFRGVRRRQEVVAETGGVVVIDDFAHHPTAVAETLRALRLRYPGRRLRAVFEPRSNTSRRRVFQREYCDALSGADEAVLARVFSKDSDPIPVEERLDPDAIASEVSARGTPCRTIDGVDAIRDYLVASARPGDVIVVMSNGAFGGLPGSLARALGA